MRSFSGPVNRVLVWHRPVDIGTSSASRAEVIYPKQNAIAAKAEAHKYKNKFNFCRFFTGRSAMPTRYPADSLN